MARCLPSLTKIAGIKLPANYKGDGMDRSTVLLGTPAVRGKDIFWEYGRNNIAFAYPKGADKSPNLAVRSGDWKLLMNHDGSDVQLYNIKKDQAESTNVTAEQPKITAELKDKLAAWWKSMPRLNN